MRNSQETTRRRIASEPRVFTQETIEAVHAYEKRETERYRFEIYVDQKEDIQRFCDLYAKKTGKKLSASRLIREFLDTFLPDTLKQFEDPKK